MRAHKVIIILTVISLFSPLTCSLMAAPTSEHSSHNDSPGKQQNQEQQGLHSCCDQEAVPVKVVHANAGYSISILRQHCLMPGTSIVVHPFQNCANLHREVRDLLAKLSVLRI